MDPISTTYEAQSDASTLLTAWQIRQDKSRLKAAAAILAQNSYEFKQVAELALMESRDLT